MNPVALRVAVASAMPILVALIYFGLVATDRYVSESKVVIRSGNSSSQSISLGGLLPIPSAGVQDVIVVSDYVKSMEMAKHLDEKFSLQVHYSNSKIDFVSRLHKNASDEDYLKYLQNMVSVVYEESNEIITVIARAFTPAMARDINREIIRKSEILINQLSDRIAEDTRGLAQTEVELAVANAKNISAKLSRFATKHDSINPGAETSSMFGLVSSLEAKLSEARALYAEKSAYLRESSSEMRSIQNRIDGLDTEVARERRRIMDDSGGGMGNVLENYKPLQVEEELARQRYAAALTALETSRAESQQQKRYLAIFVRPNLPSSSTEPDRFIDALGTVLLTLLLYAIFALCRAAVREHIDFAH